MIQWCDLPLSIVVMNKLRKQEMQVWTNHPQGHVPADLSVMTRVVCFSQTKFVSKCPIVWHMSYFSYSAHSVENISDNKSFINANDKYKGSHTIYVIN
jgi:hypothetical protein